MKPIKFAEANTTFAKDQPEYLPLPAHKSEDGQVISCWEPTLLERLKILFGGKLWILVLTFNQRLQPQLPMVNYPFVKKVY